MTGVASWVRGSTQWEVTAKFIVVSPPHAGRQRSQWMQARHLRHDLRSSHHLLDSESGKAHTWVVLALRLLGRLFANHSARTRLSQSIRSPQGRRTHSYNTESSLLFSLQGCRSPWCTHVGRSTTLTSKSRPFVLWIVVRQRGKPLYTGT